MNAQSQICIFPPDCYCNVIIIKGQLLSDFSANKSINEEKELLS